jgi:hypothetical protein
MMWGRRTLRLGLVVVLCIRGHAGALPERSSLLKLPGTQIRVDLQSEAGLREAIRVSQSRIQQSEEQERQLHEERRRLRANHPFVEMPYCDLKRYFSSPRRFISEKDERGWKELRRLASVALDTSDLELREGALWQMREIAAAIRNNYRSPSPPHMELLQPPLYYLDYANNPIAKGEAAASNLQSRHTSDSSARDPRPSSFWSRRPVIDKLDLFHGFGRIALPRYEDQLWSYDGPKTSYGGCPGFEARAGQTKIKVKFAETTSEPFAARIFWALGFNVEPTDYVHSLKLKYDRRFFREFHLRKDVQMKVRALIVPIYTVHFQQRHDPFDYICVAVLRNGERISGKELKERLFENPRLKHPEDSPGNFRAALEMEIDYLITTPANVQLREGELKSIGPWDFNSLDHADRREVRGAGLLGAWVGWCDSRFENTRLKIVRRNGTNELRHYFTDLGGGLGRAQGVLSRHCECPNDFGWRFTRPRKPQGKGKMTVPFQIVDYQPIEDTEAFRRMTYDDARWMARIIGELSEDQIVTALVASGFDATEVRIYTEKLISRRDWMIRDLALASEVPLLRPRGAEEDFTYDPQRDPIPEVSLSDGQRIKARRSVLCVQHGKAFPELHTRTAMQRAGSEEFLSQRESRKRAAKLTR